MAETRLPGPWCLGIDTSNYTTSAAGCDAEGRHRSLRTPIPVREGERGVRQSDAVFHHVRQLPPLVERLCALYGEPPAAVAVSATPRDVEDSYMPCFLAGLSVARSIAAALDVSCHKLSHQRGHVLAALLGCGRLDLIGQEHLALHISGGTTELLHVAGQADGGGIITLLGGTADLNAGQLVDRCGLQLGLNFPCGPELERLAEGGQPTLKPMAFPTAREIHLSGLENRFTQLLQQAAPADAALWVLRSLSAALVALVDSAIGEHPLPLVAAGGVLSNKLIRGELEQRYSALSCGHDYAADNACGVALFGALQKGG